MDDDDDEDDELEDEVDEDKAFNNELIPTFDRPIKAISGTPQLGCICCCSDV